MYVLAAYYFAIYALIHIRINVFAEEMVSPNNFLL